MNNAQRATKSETLWLGYFLVPFAIGKGEQTNLDNIRAYTISSYWIGQNDVQDEMKGENDKMDVDKVNLKNSVSREVRDKLNSWSGSSNVLSCLQKNGHVLDIWQQELTQEILGNVTMSGPMRTI